MLIIKSDCATESISSWHQAAETHLFVWQVSRVLVCDAAQTAAEGAPGLDWSRSQWTHTRGLMGGRLCSALHSLQRSLLSLSPLQVSETDKHQLCLRCLSLSAFHTYCSRKQREGWGLQTLSTGLSLSLPLFSLSPPGSVSVLKSGYRQP